MDCPRTVSWGEAECMWTVPDPARDARVDAWMMNQFGVSFGLASDGFFHDMARYEVKTSSEVKMKTSQCD